MRNFLRITLGCVAVLATGLLIAGHFSGSPKVSHAGDKVSLNGCVYDEKFFGPPNYGENPATDKSEVACILRLNDPVDFLSGSGERTTLSEVQLIGFNSMKTGTLEWLTGRLEEVSQVTIGGPSCSSGLITPGCEMALPPGRVSDTIRGVSK